MSLSFGKIFKYGLARGFSYFEDLKYSQKLVIKAFRKILLKKYMAESGVKRTCRVKKTRTCSRKTSNGKELIFGQQLQCTTKRTDKKTCSYGSSWF